MNTKVLLLFILLGWLYTWSSKESFNNFQRFCNRITSPKNIEKPTAAKKDIYGFPKTKKEQKTTLQKVANGNIDILIGTHRIVSKDVYFLDLGLLIIDEEQKIWS